MQHDTPAPASTETPAHDAEILPVDELDVSDRHFRETSAQARQADDDLREFQQRMQQNPQLALLALNMLEPHIDNFRQHMQLLDTPGYETAMIPFNWNVGSSDHEIVGVTPRIMLRRAMYHISSALTTQAMSMGNGRKADTDKLKDIYLATASARWADEILNGTRHTKKSAPKTPNPSPKPRGGKRPGAGRPRKTPTLRPLTDLTNEEDETDEN